MAELQTTQKCNCSRYCTPFLDIKLDPNVSDFLVDYLVELARAGEMKVLHDKVKRGSLGYSITCIYFSTGQVCIETCIIPFEGSMRLASPKFHVSITFSPRFRRAW